MMSDTSAIARVGLEYGSLKKTKLECICTQPIQKYYNRQASHLLQNISVALDNLNKTNKYKKLLEESVMNTCHSQTGAL